MIDFKIMLDSGAFSAWTKGAVIDIVDYMSFIDNNHEYLHHYFNLDVIPGRPREKVRVHDKEMAARASWLNYKSMRRAGYNPVPVYHFGEDVKWLHKILDDGNDLIGIGGLVRQPRPLLRRWLDTVFEVLCDGSTYPKVKVHGLGMTSLPLMLRYPWSSVDSVSWMLHTGFGFVYVADRGYDELPLKIHISIREEGGSIGSAVTGGRSYDAYGPRKQAFIRREIERRGYDFEDVRRNAYTRATVNYDYYKEFSDNHVPAPRVVPDRPLFGQQGKVKKATPPEFKVVFGTPGFITNALCGYTSILNYRGEGSRILSYHYWSAEKKYNLDQYVKDSDTQQQELAEHAKQLREQGLPYRHPKSSGASNRGEGHHPRAGLLLL